jgi:hypothetical protein
LRVSFIGMMVVNRRSMAESPALGCAWLAELTAELALQSEEGGARYRSGSSSRRAAVRKKRGARAPRHLAN